MSEKFSHRSPRIGIAPTRVADQKSRDLLGVRPRYYESLHAAGALVFLIASVEPEQAPLYLEGLDGLLLPGGSDLPPALYGEAATGAGLELLDDDIARTQVALARAALAVRLPTLGICLGCQVMNVACGGTLIQDLDSEPSRAGIAHPGSSAAEALHEVEVAAGSRLADATGVRRLEVVSHHHQAVRALGRELMATAASSDKVIEAVEHREAPFFLGVQWHPERSPESAGSRSLFAAFVQAAMQRRSAHDA